MSLWGSPADFWMSSIASPPAAAGLLTMMTGCLTRLFFWIAPWIVRAIWSEDPPGGKGTMISIGFVGSQACAEAADNNRAAIAACTATLMAFPLAVLFAARGPFILTSTASLPHRRPRDEAVRMDGRLPVRSGNRRKPEIERRSLDLG